MAGYRLRAIPRSKAAIPSPAAAPNIESTSRRRARTVRIKIHQAEMAACAATPAGSEDRPSRSGRTVPAARAGASRSWPCSSDQVVEGTPLRVPATIHARRADRTTDGADVTPAPGLGLEGSGRGPGDL